MISSSALHCSYFEDAFLRFQSFKDEAHSELWLKGQKGRVTGNWIQYNEALAMGNRDKKSSVDRIAAIMSRCYESGLV
jgi:hypothetical protein